MTWFNMVVLFVSFWLASAALGYLRYHERSVVIQGALKALFCLAGLPRRRWRLAMTGAEWIATPLRGSQ